MGYRIKTVAELTGISKNTLIAWERRHGLVVPNRTSSGYRDYNDEEVALLQKVKEMIDSGYRISEVVELIQQEEYEPSAPTAAAVEGITRLRHALLKLLLDFDGPGAEVINRRLVTLPFETTLREIYLPIQHEIGTLWESGDATVAQEHYVSAWCRTQVIAMLRSLDSPRIADEAVLASPPGERHEFGLLSAAVCLALRGLRITYLGADVPIADLCDLVRKRQPQYVCVSVIHKQPHEKILAYAYQLRGAIPRTSLLMFGGRGTEGLKDHSTENMHFGVTLEQLETLAVQARHSR